MRINSLRTMSLIEFLEFIKAVDYDIRIAAMEFESESCAWLRERREILTLKIEELKRRDEFENRDF